MPAPAHPLSAAPEAVAADPVAQPTAGHARRPRVLFLAKHFPWPPASGGVQRSFHQVRGLARTHDVSVLALGECPHPGGLEAFVAASGCTDAHAIPTSSCRFAHDTREPLPVRAWGALQRLVGPPRPEIHYYWWSEALVAELAARRARDPVDFVFASQSWMAEHAHRAGFRTIVVDVDDLVSEVERQKLAARGWSARLPLDRLRNARARSYERLLPRRFAGVLVAKADDLPFFPAPLRHRVAVLPNGVAIPAQPAPGPGRHDTLLFVGMLAHEPNLDAIRWFTRDVLPRIWAVRPDVRFQVAGFGSAAPLAEALADPRCHVAESPVELAPFYEEAGVVVTPIRIGSGTRIKVLEALAHGRALVSTSFAPEGLGLQDGVHLALADTPEALAERCLALLADPAHRAALGAAGRARVAERFDWRRIEAQLDGVGALVGARA